MKGSRSPHGRWKETAPAQSGVRRSRSGCDDDGGRARCTPPRGRARGGQIRPLSRGMHSAACNARFASFDGEQFLPAPPWLDSGDNNADRVRSVAPPPPFPSDAMIGWSTEGSTRVTSPTKSREAASRDDHAVRRHASLPQRLKAVAPARLMRETSCLLTLPTPSPRPPW
jgi:hypothetical protein